MHSKLPRQISDSKTKDVHPSNNRRVQACNALYAQVNDARGCDEISDAQLRIITAAIMLIESILVPKYAFYSIATAWEHVCEVYEKGGE